MLAIHAVRAVRAICAIGGDTIAIGNSTIFFRRAIDAVRCLDGARGRDDGRIKAHSLATDDLPAAPYTLSQAVQDRYGLLP